MGRSWLVAGALALLAGAPAVAQERMPAMKPEAMTPEQKAATDKIAQTRRTLSGPLSVWVRSPPMGERLAAVGEYVRFQALPKQFRELAIMIASAESDCQLEFDLHYREAINAGLKPEIFAAIADRRRPEGMSADEAMVYDFSVALHRDHGRMSDALFESVRQRFGEPTLVDLIGVNGYYGLVGMTANAAQSAIPANSAAPTLKPRA